MRRKKLYLPGLDGSMWQDKSRRWRRGDLEEDDNVEQSISQPRFKIYFLAIFLILLLFLGRLFGLMVVNGAKNRELAENNRIKLVETEAERGEILDRNGKILAQSQRQFILKNANKESEISRTTAKQLEEQGKASENYQGSEGVILEAVKRKYPLLEASAHVLGYTSVAQKEEVEKGMNVSRINAIGRLGIEENYSNFLEGKVGKKLIEVDAEGKKVSILGTEDPIAGRNVHTTLDLDLQKISFEALKKAEEKAGTKRGAIVVSDVQTGEVLALASSPSFNPEDIGKSVTDENKPFFNRVVQGNYPPGSVFKIAVALGGLDSKNITKDDEIEDTGHFELGGENFTNWFYNQYGKTDGFIKIEKAIARSNDVFFYRLAQKMGLDPLRSAAIKLGFGQKTGIDLPNESYGLVPDEVWKKSTTGDGWYTGDTLHLSIGQGFMLVTPMQINAMTAYVASGKLTKPYLVSKIDAGIGGKEIDFGSKVVGQNLFSQDNLSLVRAGMQGACETGGTGYPFFDAKYKVGCKTGTAEEAGGNPHAWFTVFAPAENPKIAVTVLVERGGEGSAVAAPVAKEVLDWWMANRNK